MSIKLPSTPFTFLITLTLTLLYFFFSTLFTSPSSLHPTKTLKLPTSKPTCNLFDGRWVFDQKLQRPLYDDTCPFHRNAWNCLRNQRKNMDKINSWKWVPFDCVLERVDPFGFLEFMRNKNVGFVGDSLNENFLVAFLCILRNADSGAKKWKRKGAWRGAYFPKFNVTVAYHRAVLLAKHEFCYCQPHFVTEITRWQPKESLVPGQQGSKGFYRVDVDVPADDWANINDFYDVLIFNTGHWWGLDKFPKETPLVFYRSGRPIDPPLKMLDGLKVVLENMVLHIQRKIPDKMLKFWRLQSPRHFYGGEWNKNGSCLFDEPLAESQLDVWFDPGNNGVNKEARQLNDLIKMAVQVTDIQLLDLTHLSEFRADAHPAIWLGKKDAVSVWGQDCMHWCLPGVPDTWVDILSQLIHHGLET